MQTSRVMYALLKAILVITLALITDNVMAQQGVIDAKPDDSLVYTFNVNDTLLNKPQCFFIGPDNKDSLWQIGNTNKLFFSSGGFTARSIMTDSIAPYSANANASFYLPTTYIYGTNFIVSFQHKYNTIPGKAGGIVEFSIDTGITWYNVIGDCSKNGNIYTDSMYSDTDTIWTGEPAFTGISNGWIYSRFQFFMGFPVLTTGATFDCHHPFPMLRFRFVSDSTSVTTDGWIIDSITLERDFYGTNVSVLKQKTLSVFPNPVTDGIINFPQLEHQDRHRIEIYDITGQQLINQPYVRVLHLNNLSKGMYIYKVKSNDIAYTGRFVVN
jgi:hypothetical protein